MIDKEEEIIVKMKEFVVIRTIDRAFSQSHLDISS